MPLPRFLHDLLSRALALLVVFLMLAAAAVWTRHLFGRSLSPATQQVSTQAQQPNAQQLQALRLDARTVRLEVRDSASWHVFSSADEPLGFIVSSAPYATEVKGFAGPTPLYIYFDTSNKVMATAAADNAETSAFFTRAAEGVLPHWNGLTAEAGAHLQVDGVSGATFSSQSLIGHMQHTLQAVSASQHRATAAPVIGWPRTLAVFAVLLLGAMVAWRLRGNARARLVVLALNVLVLGFWCGQFLSLSLLRGWIAHGLDPMAYLPTVAVLLVAIVLPFVGKKHYYCTWVCPYGSLQELTARLPLPRIPIAPAAYTWMRRLRWGVLGLLLLLLWTGLGGFLLDYEPFTAFLVTTASPAVLVLSATFLLASCFVPRLWCRSLCPMGALLDLTEK